ncbi:MAG TPA: hypothetical protein VGS41_06270, partial [Chthonomonadales bacterium]|nr:hypothetical protein [Chthonomonadales bacterium]
MNWVQNRILLIVILVLAALAIQITFFSKVLFWPAPMRYGLDIRGGVRVVLRPRIEEYRGGTWTAANLDGVVRILDRRVNSMGVSEPVITTEPQNNRIIVELPGVKNEQEAIKRIKSTASLEFYLLPQLGDKDNRRPAIWRQETTTDPKTGEKQDILVDATTGKPLTDAELNAAIFDNPLVKP